MKKLVFLLICILAGVIIGGRVLAVKETPPKALPPTQKTLVKTLQPSQVQPVTPFQPRTLTIPKLNITSAVESVGMDKEGRMDVPKDSDNVAWYNLGFKPGTLGSAVMAGHYDKATGAPAVFYNLSSLRVGDSVIVTGADNTKLTFMVTAKKLYPYNNFPLQTVFNTTDKPRLNLITCDGVWSSTSKNYSSRLVIFTELAPS